MKYRQWKTWHNDISIWCDHRQLFDVDCWFCVNNMSYKKPNINENFLKSDKQTWPLLPYVIVYCKHCSMPTTLILAACKISLAIWSNGFVMLYLIILI